MNLVIDCGNTRIKAAVFSGDRLVSKSSFASLQELKSFASEIDSKFVLVSSVSYPADEVLGLIHFGKKFVLTYSLPLPIKILYETPQTLGVDRVAAVCGALSSFPGKNCLVIDAGTCITYDFIDAEANYLGGAISPGINMRFEAMHILTKRLPLVTPAPEQLIGSSTEASLRSGVMNGILGEVKGFIDLYRAKYPDMEVVLCGGDTSFFENNLKPTIFAAPDLVLSGLNRILLHNAS